MAERQRFEPWVPCGIHAFQACAFSHSAISPVNDRLFESTTARGSPFDDAAAKSGRTAALALVGSRVGKMIDRLDAWKSLRAQLSNRTRFTWSAWGPFSP